MSEPVESVVRHYAHRGDLDQRILGLLRDHGIDISKLTAADLAPLDQFHIRGEEASRELATLAGLGPGMAVLELGAGIGGPARMLAARHGCLVTGVDLTEAYCRTAERLTDAVGLSRQVRFICADATALPFEGETFERAWTQHATMNIADKPALYGEIARVLRPGGRLVLYDVVAGPEQPIRFPVLWAANPEWSHLLPAPRMRALIAEAGLAECAWNDSTDLAIAWSRARRRQAAAGTEPLGPHRYMGAEFPEMAANVGRNLEERRIEVVQGLFEKSRAGVGDR